MSEQLQYSAYPRSFFSFASIHQVWHTNDNFSNLTRFDERIEKLYQLFRRFMVKRRKRHRDAYANIRKGNSRMFTTYIECNGIVHDRWHKLLLSDSCHCSTHQTLLSRCVFPVDYIAF